MSREQQIRDRVAAATPGDFTVDCGGFSSAPDFEPTYSVNGPPSDFFYLKNEADAELFAHSKTDLTYLLDRVKEKDRRIAELEARIAELEDEGTPAVCDVEGCDNEPTTGGCAWPEAGYWRVCSDHHRSYLAGNAMPQMRQEAIDKEATRDPVTGVLPKEPA